MVARKEKIRKQHCEFGSEGTIESVIDTVTGVVKMEFDDTNGLDISDQFANLTTIREVDDHAEITSPYGEVTRLDFNTAGLLSSVTNPKGEKYLLGYTSTEKLNRYQKPGGQVSQMTYNSLGRLTKDIGPGGFSYTIGSTITRSGTDQIHSATLTTASGLITRKTLTSKTNGSTSTINGPNGMVSTNTFVRGVSDISVDPYGQRTQLTYAQDPRFGSAAPYVSRSEFTVPSTTIDVITDVTKTASLADPDDLLSHQTLTTTTRLQNDANRVYTSTYTASTKTWVHASPLNRTSKLSYNASGLVKSTQVGTKSPRTFAYDARGRLTSVTQTAQRVSQMTYDSHGRLATFRNPLLQIESYLYDTAGRMTQKTGADGRTTLYAFDSNGRMTILTTPSNRVHRFAYNDFDLVSQYTPPLIGGVTVGSISYQYNLDRKLTSLQFNDGKSPQHIYDTQTGFLTATQSTDGNYAYTYVPNTDLAASITSPDGVALNMGYVGSKFAQERTTTPHFTSQVDYAYDNEFRRRLETPKAGSTSGTAIALVYDRDSRLTNAGAIQQTMNGNGDIASTTLGVVKEAIVRNSFGEITQDKFSVDTTVLYQQDNTVDALGRISQRHEYAGQENGTVQYVYDTRGRLLQVKDGATVLRSYRYDGNGNRLGFTAAGAAEVTATYDTQDRMTRYGANQYTYSDHGELKTKTAPGPAVTNYTFDVYGHLKSVTLPNGKTVSYKYDGRDRRVAKLVNGTFSKGWIYNDADQVIAEVGTSGLISKQFVYLSKTNVPDYMISAGKRLRIISNQVGTPKMIVDSATGAILEKINLDEFGNGTNSTQIPFGFAGGLFDADTGFVHFGARDYDPMAGRWVSRDPILFAGGDTNLFSYSFNDPINFIDPSGLSNISLLDPEGGGGGPGSSGSGGGGPAPAWVTGGRGGRFTPDQSAVIDLAKQANKQGGLTLEEAKALVKWANEVGLSPARIDPAHPGTNTTTPHIHVGPVNHVPICK